MKSIGDLDVDSEAEDNMDWLQQMYHKRIEEFTDVNPVNWDLIDHINGSNDMARVGWR